MSSSELAPHFRGADVVIHLAWLIQPGRDPATLRATNVDGSRRVFDAVAAAGVPALVYASSIGAYAPGPRPGAWTRAGRRPASRPPPTRSTRRRSNAFRTASSARRPRCAWCGCARRSSSSTRPRPASGGCSRARSSRARWSVASSYRSCRGRSGFLFQAVPLARRGRGLPAGGAPRRARSVQHRSRACPGHRDAWPAFEARPLSVSPRVLRAGAALSYRLHLQPAEPGWLDMGLELPLMDTTRAREELGWAAGPERRRRPSRAARRDSRARRDRHPAAGTRQRRSTARP